MSCDNTQTNYEVGVTKDVLLAILKRKEKELKATTTKLSKLESSYLQLFKQHEEAMRSMAMVNSFLSETQISQNKDDSIQDKLQQFQQYIHGCSNYRAGLEMLTSMIFPNDKTVSAMFNDNGVVLDVLRAKWLKHEEDTCEMISAVQSSSRSAIMASESRVSIAEKKANRLDVELLRINKEKAQLLLNQMTNKPQNGRAAILEEKVAETIMLSVAVQVDQEVCDSSTQSDVQPSFLQCRPSGKSNLDTSVADTFSPRQNFPSTQLTDPAVTSQQSNSCNRTLESEIGEKGRSSERDREQRAVEMLKAKDAVLEKLRQKINALELHQSTDNLFGQLALRQADRDEEVLKMRRQVVKLQEEVLESRRATEREQTQGKLLKETLRDLERSHKRQDINLDYAKHIILKYIEYTKRGETAANTLVPVISTLLQLSAQERSRIS